MNREKTYKVLVEKTADGWYIAEIPHTPVVTQARSLMELKENLKDALRLIKEIEQEECIQEHFTMEIKG